jgi:hypothetical protein
LVDWISELDGLSGLDGLWAVKDLIRRSVPFPAQYLLHSYCSKFPFTERLEHMEWQHSLLAE